MGFKVTYGVAPNKSAVIKPVWNKIMELGWNDSDFGLIKNPMATYEQDASGKLTDVKSKNDDVVNKMNCNFLIYSIDEKADVEAMREFVENKKTYLNINRPYPTCPNSNVEVTVANPSNFDFAPFVNMRDEVQNAAKFGAEQEKEKLQKKEEELENANDNLEEATASGDAAAIAAANLRKGAATVAVKKATEAYEKATTKLTANLRQTLVNSYGYSVHISATMLPTFQEMQMYGTHTMVYPLGEIFGVEDDNERNELFAEIGVKESDFESVNPDKSICQDVRVLPPVKPNYDSSYIGVGNMKKVEYSSVYTKTAVHSKYCSLIRAHFEALVDSAQSDEERSSARDALSNVSNYILPITHELFDEGSFSQIGLHKPKGSKNMKKISKELVDVAKMITYMDTSIVGVSPTSSIVIKAESHANNALLEYNAATNAISQGIDDDTPEEVHDILPTTVVSVIQQMTTKSERFNSTAFCNAKQITDILIEKNARGVVAVWSSSSSKDQIRREFPNAEFASAGPSKGKSSIYVFSVSPSLIGNKGVLQPITNDCSDFDDVVTATRRQVTREALENTHFFCIGYEMFTGAITLTTTVEPDSDHPRPLLVCPKTCIYACTKQRSQDSSCQIIGRSCNDIPYQTSYFLTLLSHFNTLDHSKEYMRGEHRLQSMMSEPLRNPLTGEIAYGPEGFPVRHSLYVCLSAVSKQFENCGFYDGPNGLGAACLGRKKKTMKTAVSDRFNSSHHTTDLSVLTDDEELEENMMDESAQLAPLPESARVPGIPYLHSCAIAWFNDKIRLGKKLGGSTLADKSIKQYRRQLSEILSAPEVVNYPGGWREIFPEVLPKRGSERASLLATVVRPVLENAVHANGNPRFTLPDDEEKLQKLVNDYAAPIWKIYALFPNGSCVRYATPEDFGYASLAFSSVAGPSAMVIDDSDDPDYNPN
jgi:hypothetical protein